MKNFLQTLDDVGDVVGSAVLFTLITIARGIVLPIEFLALLVTPKEFDEKK